MRVCVSVCMHACVNVWYTWRNACMVVAVEVLLRVCVYVCMLACVYVCMCDVYGELNVY